MTRAAFTLCIAGALALAPAAMRAQTSGSASASDRREVLATIDNFLKGLRTKDTALMAAQTDSLTRLTLLRRGPNGTRVMTLTGPQFIALTTKPNEAAYDEPIRNPVVHVDGDLASVWAEYQVRRDGKVTHCGFDAFHLARLGGKWKILNVSDTYRQTGCGDPWPNTTK